VLANNDTHPTRDTAAFINLYLEGAAGDAGR
jgi:hypothetical protein